MHFVFGSAGNVSDFLFLSSLMDDLAYTLVQLDLNSKLLPNTVVMLAVQGGHARVAEISNRRRLCQSQRTASIWSSENEELFQAAVNECREGNVWWLTGCKGPSSSNGLKKETKAS